MGFGMRAEGLGVRGLGFRVYGSASVKIAARRGRARLASSSSKGLGV